MDFLKPPTDNLYKFVAICGLLLFVVSLTYPVWLWHQTRWNSSIAEGRLSELEMQKELAITRQAEIAKNQDKIVKETASLEARLKEIRSGTSTKNSLEIDDIRDRLKEMRVKSDSLSKENGEIFNSAFMTLRQTEIQQRLANWENRNAWILIVFGLLGAFFGLLLSFLGFALWYTRAQVHLDRLLLKQLAEELPSHGTSETNSDSL